jgi:uncharacterized protein with HEPN domain
VTGGTKKPKFMPLQIIGFARLWIARIKEWAANDTEESFTLDSKLQAAVERGFLALGEALKDIPQDILDLEPDIPWQDAMGFRNVLAHDYFEGIEEKTMWATIQKGLGPLDAALERLEQKVKKDEVGG